MVKGKKVIKVTVNIMLFIMILFVSTTFALAESKNITGVPIDFTPIYDVNDLYKINVDPNGKYILMNDIDLSETNGGSLDAGNGWVPLKKFSGVFDGNGHCIQEMTIHGNIEGKSNDVGYGTGIGLFESIGKNGIIKNLGLKDINIDIVSYGDWFSEIGGIVGYDGTWNDYSSESKPKIYNCFVTGKIKASSDSRYSVRVGGILGSDISVEVKNCYTDINMKIEDPLGDIGGIIGFARSDASCINCYAIGEVKNGKMILGDRYEYDDDIMPENCYYLTSSGTDSYGQSLTSAQMQMPGSFPSFDFYNTWIIDSASPYPYPQLRSCMQVNPVSIKLTSLPLKQNYSVGQVLDMSGASLDVIYEDGTTSNIPVSEYMVSCDMSLIGSQTATISYGECTENFKLDIEKYNPNLYAVQKYSKEVGENFKLQISTESDGAISFVSKNAGIAMVDANGLVKTLRSGIVEIIITQAETNQYKADTRIVTIEIGEHAYKTVFTPASTNTDGSYVEICSKCGSHRNKSVIYAASNIVLSPEFCTYNGNNQKPSVIVRDRRSTLLKYNTDYTVSYPKKIKNVRRYIVVIKLKGNYKGTIKKTFSIIPKGSFISKIKSRKKGFAVKWKRQLSQTSGYEIEYSLNRKFAKKTTKTIIVGNRNTISKSISKLKAKKKYYVRIRTYKTTSVLYH